MSGAAKLSSAIVGLLFVANSISTQPVPYITVWGALFLTLYFDSFCRIWTFNIDTARKNHSSRSSAMFPSSTSRTQGNTQTTGVDIEM